MKILYSVVCLFLSNYIFAQNVGVGITSPEVKFHLFSSDSNALRIENSNTLNSNVSNGLYFKTGDWFTGALKHIGTNTNSSRTSLFGYASPSTTGLKEYLSITDAGNVGINNINPTDRLSVTGNARVTGNVGGGTITSNGTIESIGDISTQGTVEADQNMTAGGTITSGGNITSGGGIVVANTSTSANGTLRLNGTDNTMEYRENAAWKKFTKPFFQSASASLTSAVRNTLIIHPTFEFVIPETGTYLVILEATTNPVFKTNGCNLLYLDNSAAVILHSKTRNQQFMSCGGFKWYIVNGANNCQGANDIPLKPIKNSILFLQKNEVLTLAYKFDMFTVPAGTLDSWSASGNVSYIKLD